MAFKAIVEYNVPGKSVPAAISFKAASIHALAAKINKKTGKLKKQSGGDGGLTGSLIELKGQRGIFGSNSLSHAAIRRKALLN